jgi:hypothetical protein
MEWDLQATVETDDGACAIAQVIIGILANGQGEADDRYAPPHWQPPEDAGCAGTGDRRLARRPASR